MRKCLLVVAAICVVGVVGARVAAQGPLKVEMKDAKGASVGTVTLGGKGGAVILALDLKGHGLSDKPQGAAEYTIEALVEHLGQALDAIGLEHPVLAGHSLGGSLIYHFAAKNPNRASGLA